MIGPHHALEELGFLRFPAAVLPSLDLLEQLLDDFKNDRPGIRISGAPDLSRFLDEEGPLRAALTQSGAKGMRPVRAVLFDKRLDRNWSLGWHQDRTICIKKKADVIGFGPFSYKDGLTHVEPPFDIIARMVTLRIHLDPVPEDNAPLLVAAGSHRIGKIPVSEIASVASSCPTHICLADRGDVWGYSTPILHASKKKTAGGRRRVLQVDYSGDELPEPLEWLGV